MSTPFRDSAPAVSGFSFPRQGASIHPCKLAAGSSPAKQCTKCRQELTLDKFAPDRRRRDGVRSWCRRCERAADNRVYDPEKYRKNRNKILSRMNAYYQHGGQAKNTAYIRKRRSIDPGFRLLTNMRRRIALALRRTKKQDTTLSLCGCSLSALKSHLAKQFSNGMTWENYGQWHVDHIRPCCSFDLTDANQQKECFHFSNLQPLWAGDNMTKHTKFGERT